MLEEPGERLLPPEGWQVQLLRQFLTQQQVSKEARRALRCSQARQVQLLRQFFAQ